MTLSSGELSAWGKAFGDRIVRFIEAEEPGTLIECPLKAEEERTLRAFVRSLPTFGGWNGLDRACVAVYAVNLAATVDDQSYRSAFLLDLGRPQQDHLWEFVYGSAIELF